MTTLRGPADADHFRVKIGRYNDRWYHDPLPADSIATATDDVWPSVSTIKKASGSDWSFVALKRVCEALEANPDCLALPYDERADKLRSINKVGLQRAGSRGTNIHGWAEQLLKGEDPFVGDDDLGQEYLPALRAWFDQYQPELFACEMVCINRATGYGGTADTCVRIDGKNYVIDWKSRGADSDHGGYPEEGAQIAAYARADYWIAEGPAGPVRLAVPNIDGGLIVSIKPDGCRTYPVELDGAWKHWEAMAAWWAARRDERSFVLNPLAPRKVGGRDVAGTVLAAVGTDPRPVGEADRRPEVHERLAPDQMAQDVMPARAPGPPDELGPANDADIERLAQRVGAIDQAPIRRWIAEAVEAGCDFSQLKMVRTRRRLAIAECCLALVESFDGDEELVRAALEAVLDDSFQEVFPTGAVLGVLTPDEAKAVTTLAYAYGAGLTRPAFVEGKPVFADVGAA